MDSLLSLSDRFKVIPLVNKLGLLKTTFMFPGTNSFEEAIENYETIVCDFESLILPQITSKFDTIKFEPLGCKEFLTTIFDTVDTHNREFDFRSLDYIAIRRGSIPILCLQNSKLTSHNVSCLMDIELFRIYLLYIEKHRISDNRDYWYDMAYFGIVFLLGYAVVKALKNI